MRLAPANTELPEVMRTPAKERSLWAKENIIIPPRTTALVAVISRDNTDDDVYVEGGLRQISRKEHFINACVTKGEDGFIAVSNLSWNILEVSNDNILVRSVNCNEGLTANT